MGRTPTNVYADPYSLGNPLSQGYKTDNNPLLPANDGLGTSWQPELTPEQVMQQKQQANHPWARGLGLAAMGALAAAAIARDYKDPEDEDNSFPLLPAILGGLAGGVGGFALNKNKYEKTSRAIDNTVDMRHKNNALFSQNLKELQNLAEAEKQGLNLGGDPGIPTFSTAGVTNLKTAQDRLEEYRKAISPYNKAVQGFGAEQITEDYEGRVTQPSTSPTPGQTPTGPVTPQMVNGRPTVTTGTDTRRPPRPSELVKDPRYQVPVGEWANIVKSGTDAGLAPSRAQLNAAQAGNQDSQTQLNKVKTEWYPEEAQAGIGAKNAQAWRNMNPDSLIEAKGRKNLLNTGVIDQDTFNALETGAASGTYPDKVNIYNTQNSRNDPKTGTRWYFIKSPRTGQMVRTTTPPWMANPNRYKESDFRAPVQLRGQGKKPSAYAAPPGGV